VQKFKNIVDPPVYHKNFDANKMQRGCPESNECKMGGGRVPKKVMRKVLELLFYPLPPLEGGRGKIEIFPYAGQPQIQITRSNTAMHIHMAMVSHECKIFLLDISFERIFV
jgi:hypothetical protein